MTAAVAQLVEKALLLPTDARNELVEALLERSELTQPHIMEQLRVVEERIAKVESGESFLIDEEEAHRSVLESLSQTK
jgi:hypothetical protein